MMIGTIPGAMIAAVIGETIGETTAAGVSTIAMTIGTESIAAEKIDGIAMIVTIVP
jgi:hypothetical protein